MLHIWSFDPGETTGWTHLSVSDGEVGHFSCGEANHLEIGNMLFENEALNLAIDRRDVIEIHFVAEKFVMNSKIAQSPWSLETTGLIRYFADRNHIPFYIQTPAQAKNLITNDVIKRAGLWVPGKGHAMDAVRHALYFLIVRKGELKGCLKSS